MSAFQPESFLRVPPFPSARVQRFARKAAESSNLGDDQLDQLMAEVKRLRVGGDYWAQQPDLPAQSYVLVRTADEAEGEAIANALADGTTVFRWNGGPCDPWHLLSGASHAIVDADDELALIAAISGVSLSCVGDGAFESLDSNRSNRKESLRTLFRDAIGLQEYLDPFAGGPLSPEGIVDLCGFWRSLVDGNRNISAAVGFGAWKRSTVAPLLWGGSEVEFTSSVRDGADVVAVWKSRIPPAVLENLSRRDVGMVEVEDGFIRSVGLGADCVPPLSIVVDPVGIYFDPSRPSSLEQLIQSGTFTSELLRRAAELRELIVSSGVNKYGAESSETLRRTTERRCILVPGQVEDDRSVQSGGGQVQCNLELLRRVRCDAPDAHIIYKPHPDVEAGHRIGAIPDSGCLRFADEIVRDVSINALIDLADEVHVNTSLAGFEALLRAKPVTTYGVPFYAGWGLTRDLGDVPPRRTARRSLDELVAATLLQYPRYLDPLTGLPCPPEVLVRRIAEGTRQHEGAVVKLRRLQGRLKKFAAISRVAH